MAAPAESPFRAAPEYAEARWVDWHGTRLAGDFGAPAEEYRAGREAVVLLDRSDRGRLELTGAERKVWLHNLVTNIVANLDDGQGTYAFALDVRGRIVFDLNILVRPGALWLDIHAAATAEAAAHLDRHLFTEDVRIIDAGEQDARLACLGPGTAELAEGLGVRHFRALPALASVPIESAGAGPGVLVRHDLGTLPGLELIVPRVAAAAWWSHAAGAGARPAGMHVLDALRIEAGIPWPARDLDEQVLPAETGQLERGVSYEKGCYLGQEIVERLRSRGAVTRMLVRLEADMAQVPALPAPLRRGTEEIGRVTSLVAHPARPMLIGLGYVRAGAGQLVGLTAVDIPVRV